MDVFDFDSYKDFLRHSVAQEGKRGKISELARAAGCTHSYMSQVLSGKPDLTPDQAWKLTEALHLEPVEAEFFFLLVLFGRAVTPTLKTSLKAKMLALKKAHVSVSGAVKDSKTESIEETKRAKYYSDWRYAAIHALTASPSFQKPLEIARRLEQNPKDVEQILEWLRKNGLVKRTEQGYEHSGQSVHLESASVHNRVNHLNWRLRGVTNTLNPDSIHYSSIFTVSLADWDRLKGDLVQFIKKQRRTIEKSPSEEGFAFCCDLFKV